MAKVVNTVDAKEEFTDLINRVAHQKERIILTRRGKEVAALISFDDYNLLLALQDKLDLQEAMEALKEAREQGLKTLAEIKEQLS